MGGGYKKGIFGKNSGGSLLEKITIPNSPLGGKIKRGKGLGKEGS